MFAAETFKVDRIFIDEEINSKLKEEIQPVYTKQMSGLPPPPLRQTTVPTPLTVGHENQQQRPTSQLITEAASSIPTTPKLEHHDSLKPTESQSNNNEEGKIVTGKTTSMQSLNQIKQNVFVWNGICTIDWISNLSQTTTAKKITIDRKSWISRLDEQTSQMIPVHYALDKIGYPK